MQEENDLYKSAKRFTKAKALREQKAFHVPRISRA
jgi:hypothetical protein